MRHLKTLAMSTVLAAGVLATPLAPVFAQTCTCPTDQGADAGAAPVAVYADEAPPPLPEYDQPPIPASGYFWTPGYWAWNSYEYFWVPGTWVEPPQQGLLWTPGYWAFVNGAYGFHRGYWGERVGFYGGVDYGFGYGGAGYEGGRWDNGRFFYNRSVTNIGEVRVTEVYDEKVTIRDTNRASFNGGPNGIDAKPSAEELEAGKAPHVAPTKDQLTNARRASRTESEFVSTNHGKPRVAGTAKPGVFEGAAVVPAKAAGGPIEPANGATPEPTKLRGDKKAGAPTPEAMTPKPETTPKPEITPKPETTPKSDVTPKPDVTLKPDKTLEPDKKLETPKPEPRKDEFDKPKDDKNFERPKPEPTKSEPMKVEPETKVEPKPEPMLAKPDKAPDQRRMEPGPMNGPKAAPQKRPDAACGHPGEPTCPK